MKAQEQSALLPIKPVIQITTLSAATIRRMVRSGTFPAPVSIGPRSKRWKRSEVMSWIDSQEAGTAIEKHKQ